MEKLRIFISSTMEDFQEERKAIAEAINQNRFWEAVHAESFIARSESPKEVCLEEVRKSHIYIGIFKKRYGYVPDNNNPRRVSAVVLEYEEAKSNHLPVIILVCKNTSDRESRLDEFLKEITDFDKGHWRKEYTTTNELIQLSIESINYELTKTAVNTIEARRKEQIRSIYNLPYFRIVKEKF
jgi:hypothetical protein